MVCSFNEIPHHCCFASWLVSGSRERVHVPDGFRGGATSRVVDTSRGAHFGGTLAPYQGRTKLTPSSEQVVGWTQTVGIRTRVEFFYWGCLAVVGCDPQNCPSWPGLRKGRPALSRQLGGCGDDFCSGTRNSHVFQHAGQTSRSRISQRIDRDPPALAGFSLPPPAGGPPSRCQKACWRLGPLTVQLEPGG